MAAATVAAIVESFEARPMADESVRALAGFVFAAEAAERD